MSRCRRASRRSDAMIPIGRGQRGADHRRSPDPARPPSPFDTILNQKGEDVVCVYVAHRSEISLVANVVDVLRERGALDYTVVVARPAPRNLPLFNICPLTARRLLNTSCTRAKKRATLVVYGRTSPSRPRPYARCRCCCAARPGVRPTPADVFYCHSRLLERPPSSPMPWGKGSMTALRSSKPGPATCRLHPHQRDFDHRMGQIFLTSDLFNSSLRPPSNVGISVEPGRRALPRPRAIKKIAGHNSNWNWLSLMNWRPSPQVRLRSRRHHARSNWGPWQAPARIAQAARNSAR